MHRTCESKLASDGSKKMNLELFNAKIGNNLRSLRSLHPDLTQEKMADLVGLSRPSIVNIEKGRQQITVYQLMLFADALSVMPTDIINHDAKQNYPEFNNYSDSELPQEFRDFVNSALNK
jgi:transcriptional regulator with XRE-family HTH domain